MANKIDLLGALKTIKMAVPEIRDIVIQVTIATIVVGYFIEVATDGSISIYSGLATFLNGTWATDVVTTFTSLSAGVKLALSLLTLVIIVIIFKSFGGEKKSKGKNV